MRTTINIDDNLLKQASEYVDFKEKTKIINEALRALIARESAKRLASLYGAKPDMEDISRRREK